MKKCQNCENVYEDNLIICPHCMTLPAEEKAEDLISSMAKQLRPYVFKKILRRYKIWFLSGFGVVGIITILTTTYTLNQMYDEIIEYLSQKLKNSVEEEFKTERIKKTVESVANNRSEKILQENILPIINDLRQNTNQKVKDFDEHINELKTDIEDDYRSLKDEVEYLKQRNSILKIADRAILPNGANSYRQLSVMYLDKNLPNEIKELISSQVLRIIGHYINISYIRNVDLEVETKGGKTKKNNDLSTTEIITFLNNNNFKLRAKAALLLSNRKEKQVPDILFQKMLTDDDLEVVKLANKSFCSITGFKSGDIPEFPPINHIKWWNENKESVLESLK